MLLHTVVPLVLGPCMRHPWWRTLPRLTSTLRLGNRAPGVVVLVLALVVVVVVVASMAQLLGTTHLIPTACRAQGMGKAPSQGS